MARAVHATGGPFIRHRAPRVRGVGGIALPVGVIRADSGGRPPLQRNSSLSRLRHQRCLGPGQPSLSQALRIGGSLFSTAAMTFAISHCAALTASPLSRFHAPISRS
jgi:hypothetical protein